jgi:hypothetical protein
MIKLLTLDENRLVPHPLATPVIVELLDKVTLCVGKEVGAIWEPIHVTIVDDQESVSGLTDWIMTVPFLMVSQRFANVLRSLDCKCEYLPLIVHYDGKTLEDEYFALNALHYVEQAIDLEQSKIGYYDAEFHSAEDVEKLVLKENALGDEPLGYLGEISHYLVSDSLAKAIQEANLVGVALIDPSAFNNY